MTKTQDLCLTMTDLHYGKKTATYNPDVFKQRMDHLITKLAQVQDNQKMPVDKLHIAMLGDVNDGSDIYATQPHHQAITNVEQQAQELADFLSVWFTKLKTYYPRIDIETVPGNHGRAGRAMHEMASWDIVTYKYLNYNLNGTITVNQHNENDFNGFLRQVKWRGHNYILYHGHDIKSWGSIPWYGMLLRLSRWNLSSKFDSFDAALMGHFHTCGSWDLNKVTIMASGTPISDDEWALQTLGWESATRWWLFGITDDKAITWQEKMELD